MAYRIVFASRTHGNTTVEVEDLKHVRSCTSCRKAACIDYPGVCDHCGKLHIRYLAHVDQDIADTLNRATSDTHEKALVRSDQEVANLGIAMVSGKSHKRMDVGCVCVAAYLVDCGVDAGIAERFQKEVTHVTSLLQKAASLENCLTDERVAESMRRFQIVKLMYQRSRKVTAAYANLRARRFADPAAEPRLRSQFNALYYAAGRQFRTASDRWKREAHGLDPRYYLDDRRPLTAEMLRDHLTRLLRIAQRRLERLSNAATYVG